MTKKDLFNAKNSSKQLENELSLKVLDVATYSDVDKDGNPIEVGVIKAEEGMYTTISSTVIKSLDMLVDIISEDGFADIVVRTRVSNSGREFYTLELF